MIRSHSWCWLGLALGFVVGRAGAQEAVDAPSAPADGDGQVDQPATLAVGLQLIDTPLTREAIFQALEEEFGIEVVSTEGAHGLHLEVTGRLLRASYADADGSRVERTIELPESQAQQIEAIALLSGNLARDDAGALLSQLHASEEDLQAAAAEGESETAEATAPEPPVPEPASPESTQPPVPAEPDAKKPEPSPPPVQDLPEEFFGASLAGSLSYPKHLDEKKLKFHLGGAYSAIGALRGVSISLGPHRNLGTGLRGAGEGAELGVIYSQVEGRFRGLIATAIGSTAFGGHEGVQASGIFSFQKNEIRGAQLSGVGSVAMSDIEGAQIGGGLSLTWGDVDGGQAAMGASLLFGNLVGFQGALGLALTTGDLKGTQLASGAVLTGGRMEGVQVAPFTGAGSARGVQVGAGNAVLRKLEGTQFGVINFAGEVRGSQFGLVNIGGNIHGNQFGLLNIAKDVEGIAFAPVNIIPGLRNQVVTYASWTPEHPEGGEAVPGSPLGHVALKFFSDPLYTQLSFGLGSEAAGDVLYAPGFAVGGRLRLIGGLFTELDGQYQFEKAFNQSTVHRHALLGRAALGYEFGEVFAVFVGGGPRLDIRVPGGNPEVGAAPHVFAGIQLF